MNELKQKVLDIYAEEDYKLFEKAYNFYKEAHKNVR